MRRLLVVVAVMLAFVAVERADARPMDTRASSLRRLQRLLKLHDAGQRRDVRQDSGADTIDRRISTGLEMSKKSYRAADDVHPKTISDTRASRQFIAPWLLESRSLSIKSHPQSTFDSRSNSLGNYRRPLKPSKIDNKINHFNRPYPDYADEDDDDDDNDSNGSGSGSLV